VTQGTQITNLGVLQFMNSCSDQSELIKTDQFNRKPRPIEIEHLLKVYPSAAFEIGLSFFRRHRVCCNKHGLLSSSPLRLPFYSRHSFIDTSTLLFLSFPPL